ncbi:MAG: GNAT family N-acetyltransferase [Bacteroidetes bacterium]|jgi:GNAT superfamily N-acetyltransferase|nr:MAG: GNAT family N-acetyltransferase [Bacteroidota bacterium]
MVTVEIRDYEPQFRKAFRELNEWWIHQYFEMEEKDYQILHDPDTHILNRGGHILVALFKGVPAGVCALLPSDRDDFDFELSKMGVAPDCQGLGIGMALGRAVLKKARDSGAKRVFLQSNTILEPAINLYRKLGFREIPAVDSPYRRCNIQMEIAL